MPFVYKKRRKNPAVQREGSRGFPDGWNTLAHPSALKNTELSELINGTYSQYGTISRRLGTRIIGQESEDATKITNIVATYKIGTDKESFFIRLSDTGIPEYYNYDTELWVPLQGTAPVGYVGTTPEFTGGVPTFNTTVFTNIVQAGGKVIFANSEDQLCYFDGDAWFVFDNITDPTTKPTVAKTGSGTGTTTYYYRYVDYSDIGGTLPSPVYAGGDADGTGYKNTMPQILDDTTYLTVTLPAATSGATSRGIFRGTTPGNETYLDKIPASQTTYVDKGEKVPSEIFGVPADNNSKGYHFYQLDSYRSTLVGTTVENGKETIVYSAGGDKQFSFSLSDGAGYADYRRGEGEDIFAIKTFVSANEDGLYVFKDSKVGVFKFDTEGATIRDVNLAIGSIAPLSIHVAGNNLRFFTREGPGTLGNEANYGNILRYSVLGIKTEVVSQQVTPANLPKASAAYFKHISYFSISTGSTGDGNNYILAYDERYGAWSLLTGMYAAVFAKNIDPELQERLYFGSSKDGNVLEVGVGKTDESTSSGTGNPIVFSLTTKQYDQGLPDAYKKYRKAALVFASLFGQNTTVQVIKNGFEVEPRLKIPMSVSSVGFGTEEWGTQIIGEAEAQDESTATLNTRIVDLKNRDLTSVKFNLMNSGIDDEIEFMGIFLYYSSSSKPLPYYTKLTELAEE